MNIKLCLIPLTLACADSITPTEPVEPAFARSGIRDRYIVTLHPPADARGLAKAHGLSPDHVYTHVLNGFAAHIPEQARAGLSRSPLVKSIEPDGIATTQAVGSWGLDRIDARSGLDGSFTPPGNGAGVTAFILDTGILPTHSDFGGRASVGADFIGDGRGGVDCNGHGTHVAGTVGGATYGVAKGVTLVAVRVLNCQGSGSWSQVIAGMDWVASQSGPCVANLSLGGGKSDAVNDAVAALSLKCAVFVAAGNEAENACLRSPASAPAATTVAASTSTDARAFFSNWGSCVDLFAPGVSITSAWNDGGTRTISGTSMASPHVAGVAALVLAEGFPASKLDSVITWRSTKGVVSDANSARADMLFSGLSDGGVPAVPPAVPPPPPAPTNLVHSVIDQPHPDTTRIRLTWTLNGSNLTGVQPWCEGPTYLTYSRLGGAVTSTTFRLFNGGWMCQVRARTDGGWGAWSTPITFTLSNSAPPPPPEDPIPPNAPSNLKATLSKAGYPQPGWSEVELRWTDNATNEDGFDIDGENTVTLKRLSGGAPRNAQLAYVPLTDGPWVVRVRAKNAHGVSSWATAGICLSGVDYDCASPPPVEPPPPEDCPSGRLNPKGKCIGKK